MLFPHNPTQGRTNSRQPSDLNGSSERCERAANAHFDVPVIGADNILPPHTNTGAYEHPQTSHYIPADLEFERHAALRAALPIDLPDPLHESPPSLGPDRIDYRCRPREFDVRSSRIAADGDLVLEHPEQEGLPSGKKTARGNERTDRVFPQAQCVLCGSRESGERTDKEGVFGRVIGAPAGYNGQVALATLAGNAGTIRIAPSKERDVRPEQPVAPEREIHTGYGVRESPALRPHKPLCRESWRRPHRTRRPDLGEPWAFEAQPFRVKKRQLGVLGPGLASFSKRSSEEGLGQERRLEHPAHPGLHRPVHPQ